MHYVENEEDDVYYLDKLTKQQKDLVRLSHVCGAFREHSSPYLFRDFLVEADGDGQIRSHPNLDDPRVRYTKCLYIKVQAIEEINPRQVWSSICSTISYDLVSLETILVDTSRPVSRDYVYDKGAHSSVSELRSVLSVHVLGRFLESGGDEVTNNGAMYIAKEIVLSLPQRDTLKRASLDDVLISDISYKVVLPYFVYKDEMPIYHGQRYASSQITRLLFSDINLVVEAPELIKRCSRTLTRLSFMLCDYDIFKQLLYDYTDDPILKQKGAPVVYTNLSSIHGALNRRNSSSEEYTVPSSTFPRLEFFHEVVEYSWQGMMGIVPHLLANVLLTSDLPRLKVIRVRTAQNMALDIRKLPSLEYVSYYQHARDMRNISGMKIAAQFYRLLTIPRLQFLRFHDQMPPIRIDNIPPIGCLYLRYMDLGMMILSLRSVAYLLGTLAHLHTAAFAVNNYWMPNVVLQDDQRLSDSLERLNLYVIGNDTSTGDEYSTSEEIIMRLPNLYELNLQSGIHKTREFFERTKNRFPWSERVAERIIVQPRVMFGKR